MGTQAERYKSQGNTALQAGLFSEAVELYTKAIALDPNSAIYFSNRSAAYASLERWREALDDGNEAASLKPEWVKGHMRRGHALMGLKKHEEARKAYLTAHQLEPGNQQLEQLVASAAAAATKEANRDWEDDLWSDDDAGADAGNGDGGRGDGGGDGDPDGDGDGDAGGGSGGGSGGSGAGGEKRRASSDGEGPAGRKRRKASARVAHELDRAIADASEASVRVALAQLGKADHALAERIVQMLEGMNAASSAGEESDGEGADDSDGRE